MLVIAAWNVLSSVIGIPLMIVALVATVYFNDWLKRKRGGRECARQMTAGQRQATKRGSEPGNSDRVQRPSPGPRAALQRHVTCCGRTASGGARVPKPLMQIKSARQARCAAPWAIARAGGRPAVLRLRLRAAVRRSVRRSAAAVTLRTGYCFG
jgi:hypothetical protein